jgi:LysR family cyn operon transcriptional activator
MPMRELAKLPLVLLTPEFGARQFVDRFLAETNLRPHVVLEMNAIEPILATIRDSGLASVLSAGAIVDPTGLQIVRLTDPAPKRTVGILWRRNGHRSAAALRMAEMIKAAYGGQKGARR